MTIDVGLGAGFANPAADNTVAAGVVWCSFGFVGEHRLLGTLAARLHLWPGHAGEFNTSVSAYTASDTCLALRLRRPQPCNHGIFSEMENTPDSVEVGHDYL